ncbi:IclR family transcriptional regulator [Scopulibacillus darangshiensis]|uniref:IclR family transcriptional regulator n=1 Tax=Scopulibacillus darangshiensis TaxID=442528 RepID=A0A4R2NZ65_9BACL|nr:IclR family transcriptional regulator [Scopulibacillus darangshiensis]TCP27028.1 IclR family transcriptional regulator [Scopulibacillus darangshiensis]
MAYRLIERIAIMNQSVLKALDILSLFTQEKHEYSLTDISNKLDMPKPTAYRLVTALESRGFLIKKKFSDHDIRYVLGLRLLELGNLVSEKLEVRKIAYPYMKKLCDEINEDVHLVIADGHEAIYIEKVEGNQALRLHTKVGMRSALHVGSGPKLLLAFKDAAFIDDYFLKTNLSALTPHSSLTSHYELSKEMEGIRYNGYSISRGEQDAETIGISYPIRDHTGSVAAALAVSGPTIRFFGERGQVIQDETQRTAVAISQQLGYRND